MRSPGNWLDSLLGRHGASRGDLAERLGITRQAVSYRALQAPDLLFIARVCEALGANIHDEIGRVIDDWTGDETK